MQIGFHNLAAFHYVKIKVLTKRNFVFIFELYFRCFFSYLVVLRFLGKFLSRFLNFACFLDFLFLFFLFLNFLFLSFLFLRILERLRAKLHNVNKIIILFVVILPEIFLCHINEIMLRHLEPKIICEIIDIELLVFIQYCIYEKFSSKDLPVDFI